MLQLHKRPRKRWTLIMGSVTLLFLIMFVIFISPEKLIARVGFFFLLFSTFFSFAIYTLNHTRRALLVSCGFTLFLFLRMLGLSHWIYPLLIVAIVITIELYNRKR